MGRHYAGVDACKQGWVAVAIDANGFLEAFLCAELGELLGLLDVDVVAIDIPIGIDAYPRRADIAAAAFVGPRRSSVFKTPPRAVLEAADYATARRIAADHFGVGVSAQAFALAPQILEADAVAKKDGRVIEVHPEVSFAALAGEPIAFSKKTWSGETIRGALLAEEGIEIPSQLGEAGLAAADDVLDAAVAAWSARRYCRGTARSLPDDPSKGEPVICY